MAYTFKPTLYSSSLGTSLKLPQPILQCQPTMSWKAQEHSVPKGTGQTTYGLMQEAARIQVVGTTSISDGTIIITQSDMWAALVAIQTYAEAAKTAKLEFFLYYPEAGDPSPNYVKYKDVWVESLSPNVGDGSWNSFSYNLTLVADNPTLYTTAPGA